MHHQEDTIRELIRFILNDPAHELPQTVVLYCDDIGLCNDFTLQEVTSALKSKFGHDSLTDIFMTYKRSGDPTKRIFENVRNEAFLPYSTGNIEKKNPFEDHFEIVFESGCENFIVFTLIGQLYMEHFIRLTYFLFNEDGGDKCSILTLA